MKICRFIITMLSAFLIGLAAVFATDIQPGRVFGDYPTLDEVYAEIESLAKSHPEMVSVTQYGASAQGRKLIAFRIARNDGKERPEALIAGNIHGNEYIGNRLAMGTAHRVIDGDGKDAWLTSLLDRMDFWIMPCINPDGYAKTLDMKGAEPWASQRKNANGVDLNRNFLLPGKRTIPLQWAGSPKPEHKNYRGAAPYSEPESKAVGDFAKSRRFIAAIDYHSWGGYFIPPKCPDGECVAKYKKMYAAYVSKQKYDKYSRHQFRLLDTFTGEMEDMLYYEHGVMGVCIELGMDKYNKPAFEKTGNRFWLFNPTDWRRWVENDADASLAAIEKVFELNGGKPLPARVRCRSSVVQ